MYVHCVQLSQSQIELRVILRLGHTGGLRCVGGKMDTSKWMMKDAQFNGSNSW